jgi:regulator of sigma E protease
VSILLVLLIFASLVLVHELGHFWAARRAGIAVEEFGLGFPPRLLTRRWGQTLYSLNLLPLGGFVKLKGEDGQDTGTGSFAAASLPRQAAVLLAGVGMNALLAWIILSVLAIRGLPPILPGQFSLGEPIYTQPPQVLAAAVQAGSPAEQAGLRRGDVIVKLDQQPVAQPQQLVDTARQLAGREVTIHYLRQGRELQANARLRPADSKEGFLGVTPFETYRLAYGWKAPLVAAGILLQLIWGTLQAFAGLLTGFLAGRPDAADQVTGPVGIVVLLGNIRQLGPAYLATFVAAISVSLAVLNSLPLPALDGGRLALLGAQRVTGRPLSPKTEALIHTAGFVFLIGLMLLVTYIDIKRL